MTPVPGMRSTAGATRVVVSLLQRSEFLTVVCEFRRRLVQRRTDRELRE